MLDTDLLKILRCPESRQPLALAPDALVQELNGRIRAGTLKNRSGTAITRPCDGALLRQDGQFAYPICEGIPVLMIDEAVPIAGG